MADDGPAPAPEEFVGGADAEEEPYQEGAEGEFDEYDGYEEGAEGDQYEEEEDDDEELDANDPILNRLQEKLTKQLLDDDLRVTEDLRVKEEELRRAQKKREDIGAELYSVQQQLAKLQMQLEGTHDSYKTVSKSREQDEIDTQQAVEVYQGERLAVLEYKGKVDVNQVECDKVNSTIRQVQAYNDAMKDEVAVTRRATYKAEEATTNLEKGKQQQDVLIDGLNRKMKEGIESLGMFEAQFAAQKKETQAASSTLFDAAREMESIKYEKKHLVQQWQSSLIGMGRRDEALAKAEEQIALTLENDQTTRAEIQGYKKQTNLVQERNESLQEITNKLDADGQNMTKTMETIAQKNAKLSAEFQLKAQALEKKDAELDVEKKSYKRLSDKVKMTQTRIQDMTNKIHALVITEDDIKSEQVTIEKGTENTVKGAEKLSYQTEDKEFQVSQFENELARVRVDALNTQAHNDSLRQTLSLLDEQLKEKTELTERYEAEIRKRNDEIEKKQAEVDRLNRKYDALTANQEDENTGPLEATIYNLGKSISGKNAENSEMQKKWITQQTELVGIMNESSKKSEHLQELHSTIAILKQKKAKQENVLATHSSEIKELEGNIKGLHNEMKKVNGMIAQSEDLQAKLTDDNFNMETDFVKKLKQLQTESIEMEASIQNTTEEKNQLLNDIVEAEKLVMLWERKIQLEKETQATLDTGVGKDVIVSMTREIHRMKLRLTALNRRQEELLKTMEGAIDKRGAIAARGRLTQLRGKDTAADLERGRKELVKKIQSVEKDVVKTEGLIKELDEQRQVASEEGDHLGAECGALRASEEELGHQMEADYWRKQCNLDVALKQQRLAKRCDAWDPSRAATEEQLSGDWAREEGKAAKVQQLVGLILERFPNLKLGIERIEGLYDGATAST